MKAILIATPHEIIPGATVFEVHHKGQLLCTITGADGPGLRVISKYIRPGHFAIQTHTTHGPVPGDIEILFANV